MSIKKMENSDSNWQDLRPQERMKYLLRTGHLSDCSFVVYDDDGQKVVLKCHKFVLMSVSPVFERMFDGDFEEASTPDNIVLNDVSGPDFQKFISYLYWHDNQRLDTYDLQSLQALIYLSKKFMVPFMTNKCLNAIQRRVANGLDPDVTIDLFEYAHQLEDDDLIKAIRSKLLANPLVYINTAAVFDLSSDMFRNFIDYFHGCVSDKIRFHTIDRYCKIQGLVPSSEPPSANSTLNASQIEDSSKKQMTDELHSGVVDEKTEKLAENMDENENKVETSSEAPSDTTEKDQSEREQQKREEYVAKLLKTIQFKSMTAYDFCSGPGVSNLLSVEQKYEILSSIIITNHKVYTFTLGTSYQNS
ncbi:uncharacterized protein LOC117788660 [Drosophila innubila]|uniref:uncharacterized protein LOC117788660 n=1 Tax=Drosophila innubila TaxID=198719 RepID=UPI00148B3893|nr:uncharacterized protein LOC117788660 [Drosophila innubila]